MTIAPQRTARGDTRRAPRSRERGPARRHDEAVIQAEVRRLARALRPYGVLHREALEQAAGASRWHDGGFDSALAIAVRSGVVARRTSLPAQGPAGERE